LKRPAPALRLSCRREVTILILGESGSEPEAGIIVRKQASQSPLP